MLQGYIMKDATIYHNATNTNKCIYANNSVVSPPNGSETDVKRLALALALIQITLTYALYSSTCILKYTIIRRTPKPDKSPQSLRID